MFTLRKAMIADIPALNALIARSARGLSTADYRPRQIEGALRGAFGVDSQLLADETYFVVEDCRTDRGMRRMELSLEAIRRGRARGPRFINP